MKQYLDICKDIMANGVIRPNRTGTDTIGIQGVMMKFDMDDGFPAVTTKQLAWKSAFAEMLGFLRGYDNAADFRKLGTKVWDMNANENEQWLNNPNRKGIDDLGRIYGVQARRYGEGTYDENLNPIVPIDQLKMCINDLQQRIDNRREIVIHWNPSEQNKQALVSCHLLYQFGIQGNRLNLSMYQRSADFPLGVPFNIAGYSWLLHVIARITNLVPGTFTHFIHDAHIYVNQIPMMEEQVERTHMELPTLHIAPWIGCLEDLEDSACIISEDFDLLDYKHHPAIKYPFSV